MLGGRDGGVAVAVAVTKGIGRSTKARWRVEVVATCLPSRSSCCSCSTVSWHTAQAHVRSRHACRDGSATCWKPATCHSTALYTARSKCRPGCCLSAFSISQRLNSCPSLCAALHASREPAGVLDRSAPRSRRAGPRRRPPPPRSLVEPPLRRSQPADGGVSQVSQVESELVATPTAQH